MSIQVEHARPPLRYRRLGGGYRRGDVEYALYELELTIKQLHEGLSSLRHDNGRLEQELDASRAEVEAYRKKEQELWATMAEALRQTALIEEMANARAREIISEAEKTALQIRADARRRVEDSAAQFNELLRRKDGLIGAMRHLVKDFEQAIARVVRGEQLFPPDGQPAPAPTPWPAEFELPPVEPEHVPAMPAPAAAAPVDAAPPAAVPAPAAPPVFQPAPAPAPAPAPGPDQHVFQSRVEIDAGPFTDFSSISAFERSLAQLPGVEDLYVRRLVDDRVLLELRLVRPAPLVVAMRQSLPYSLEVRSIGDESLVLDVAPLHPAPQAEPEGADATNGAQLLRTAPER